MKLRKDPDWKRIARERLDKIHAHERRWGRVSAETKEIVRRGLRRALHAHCVAYPALDAAVGEIIDAVAEYVAREMGP